MRDSAKSTTINCLPLVSLFAAIAIPWFALQTTGSATQTGIAGFFNVLPVVLAGLLGGTLVDHLGYKGASVIADLASGVTVMITNFLDSAFGGVIRPVFVKQVYGSALDLGLIIAANDGGAALGTLIFGAVGHRLPRYAAFVSMFMLTGLRFWIFALYLPLPFMLVATFITSIGAGPLNPIIPAMREMDRCVTAVSRT